VETKVETIGEKIRFGGRKWLKRLARPEGFEPPTPRSVVRYSPYSQEIAVKRSPLFKESGAILFMSLAFVPYHCGNNFGNSFDSKFRSASTRVVKILWR
jgi:hypothetical protein